MTENNYSSKTKKTTITLRRVHFLMLTMMCAMISVVSFMAFLKIENNFHALMILLSGISMSVLIFVTGKGHTKT